MFKLTVAYMDSYSVYSHQVNLPFENCNHENCSSYYGLLAVLRLESSALLLMETSTKSLFVATLSSGSKERSPRIFHVMCLSSTICKMSTILYFAFVLFCSSAIAEDSMLEVDFTDTIGDYQRGNYYFSVIGRNVSFTCEYSSGRYNVPQLNFIKGISPGKTPWIFSGEMLRAQPPLKYLVTKESSKTLLNIYNLDDNDSSLYACWYAQKINTTYARILFNFVHLHVLATKEEPRFCLLNQNTSGVFHPEDDLVLICPRNVVPMEIKFNNKDGPVIVEGMNLTCTSLDGNICKMNVTKVTLGLNATQIYCTKSNGGMNLCRKIPNLTVFDSLMIHIKLEERQNRGGRLALLTCTSFPSLLSHIQWHVEGNNLMILNNTGKFNQLRIANQTFPNATKINFEATCKITIGKISNSTTVYINYTFDPLSPSRVVRTTRSSNRGLPMTTEKTSMAGLDTAMSETQTTAFTSTMATVSPQSLTLVGIIVPATAIPIVVIIFILLICCFRSSKSATVKRDSSRSGTDNLTRDNNYEDKDSRIQLGLSPENSQVVGNVLYEPYRGNNT